MTENYPAKRERMQRALEGLPVGLRSRVSLLSAHDYLRVVVTMYMRESDSKSPREPWLDFSWALTTLPTVALSFLPMALFGWAGGAMG